MRTRQKVGWCANVLFRSFVRPLVFPSFSCVQNIVCLQCKSDVHIRSVTKWQTCASILSPKCIETFTRFVMFKQWGQFCSLFHWKLCRINKLGFDSGVDSEACVHWFIELFRPLGEKLRLCMGLTGQSTRLIPKLLFAVHGHLRVQRVHSRNKWRQMVCVSTQEWQHDGRHSEKEFWDQPRKRSRVWFRCGSWGRLKLCPLAVWTTQQIWMKSRG